MHVVYADHVIVGSDLSGFARAEMDDDRDSKAASVAKAAAKIAGAAGVRYTFERREEAPADAILRAADSHAASHPGAIVGSVPVQLMHESRYAVLTMP